MYRNGGMLYSYIYKERYTLLYVEDSAKISVSVSRLSLFLGPGIIVSLSCRSAGQQEAKQVAERERERTRKGIRTRNIRVRTRNKVQQRGIWP